MEIFLLPLPRRAPQALRVLTEVLRLYPAETVKQQRRPFKAVLVRTHLLMFPARTPKPPLHRARTAAVSLLLLTEAS